MKITKEHKKVFKKALELYTTEEWRTYLCPAMLDVASTGDLMYECREILYHYFDDIGETKTNPRPCLIWRSSDFFDSPDVKQTLRDNRILALHFLINMP